MDEANALAEPLTVKLSEICKGPRCGKPVTGKAVYCCPHCRMNAFALRTVAELLAGVPDKQAMKILQAWRLGGVKR